MRRWVMVSELMVLMAVYGRSAAIVTTQSGISQVEVANVRVAESSDAKTDGFVSVFTIWGSQSTPEARTAARSGAHEMAANARIDDKMQFSRTDWTTVLSQASYSITLAPDNVFVRDAVVDFVLPPSYLEVTSTAEIPFNALDTVLLADLRVCFAVACTLSDSHFHLQANLEQSFDTFNWFVDATGDPGLDLTPLQNPTITDVGGGRTNFVRTTNVGFPLFRGHLDLGIVPAGTPLTLEYIMQARARGLGLANIGIASINDPFVLSTDPVQSFDPLTLTVTDAASAVPEPGSWLFCSSGIAILVGSGRVTSRLKRAS